MSCCLLSALRLGNVSLSPFLGGLIFLTHILHILYFYYVVFVGGGIGTCKVAVRRKQS